MSHDSAHWAMDDGRHLHVMRTSVPPGQFSLKSRYVNLGRDQLPDFSEDAPEVSTSTSGPCPE